MPTATSSSSHTPAVKPGQTRPLPSSTTQLWPKTPERKRDLVRSVPATTPLSIGTSILQKVQIDTDEAQTYDSDKYEQYITQDFERHRVFIDIEVFMTHILRVPENWETLWERTIQRIKCDQAFTAAQLDYCCQCGTQGVAEASFYMPLVAMGNAILSISKSDGGPVQAETPQIYIRNDPKRILCGSMKNLSPDIVAVHETLSPHICSGIRDGRPLNRSNLTWAQPLQVLEVKPWDGALVDGSCMPRLKVNGRDPQQNHARPHTPSRARKIRGAICAPTIDKGASVPELPPPRKRPADKLLEPDRKTQKVHHEATPGGASSQAGETLPRRPQTNETECQKDAYLQVGRYLMEQFSIPAFRSHATIGLVDRDRIQFYHANHSVILVTSAINFSSNDRTGGVDKFIAIVIAFSRLSLQHHGILDGILDGITFKDNGELVTSKLARGAVRMQDGNKLEFGGDAKTPPFVLTYGKVIFHEPSLAGRSTAVLHATSPQWKDINLVIKISWPGSERVAENAFLDKAIDEANSTPTGKWALDHLPRVLYAQDVRFDPDSTHGRIASLFDSAKFVDEGYAYQKRTLRIIIQERLHPIKMLTNVKDIAQVLLDVTCIHRWLYDHPGILHRDLSMSNIMYRVKEGKIYGVLGDYDLSSWTASLTSDYTKTSQQRTGTPPFMAHGLLDGTDALHQYRHDVESLFYIVLILTTRYEIRAPEKGEGGGVRTRGGLNALPFEVWFDQPNYESLASFKRTLISSLTLPDLSPTFEAFRGWLSAIHASFRRGLRSKEIHGEELLALKQAQDGGLEGKAAEAFDNETLGGEVKYSTLISSARSLEGKLEGLIIRYDPPSPPPSASTGAAQAGA